MRWESAPSPARCARPPPRSSPVPPDRSAAARAGQRHRPCIAPVRCRQKTEHHLPCRRKGNIIRQRNLPSPQCSRPAEGTNPRFGTVSIAQLHRAEILPGTKTGCAVFPPLLLIRTADGGQIVIVGTRVPDGIALRTEGFGGISPRARIQENRLTVRKDRYGTDIVVVVAGVVMPALDGEIQPALLIGELPRDEQLKILQQDALRRLISGRVLPGISQRKPAKPVVGRLPTAPEVPERTVLPCANRSAAKDSICGTRQRSP